MLLVRLIESSAESVVLCRCGSQYELEQLFIFLVSQINGSDLSHLLFIEDLVLVQKVEENSLSLHLLHEERVVVDQRLSVLSTVCHLAV